ncbi:anaphase-promoting complex subunit 1-like [Actinidia eriantha]|uniref:anaphase-promoting complex subunit 1-like n=1 Tax=Actinidia eriantha TaxID=165200 RepID=UPI002584FE40|nr:anaphase-promoting complex subunit 1-like [Actinidia eriantha]
MMDGTQVNVDITAPGAIIALALMFLKSESDLVVSRLSIPCTRFNLQYVKPDFIMLRVIAQNLIMWSRVHPSKKIGFHPRFLKLSKMVSSLGARWVM